MSNGNPLPSFEIEVTADGSPTLRLQGQEPMHSLQGALSETLYIYGPVIELALEQPEPRLLSVGLGLGYNELLTMALSLRAEKTFSLVSLESEEWLRDEFVSWASGSENSLLHEVYQSLLGPMAKSTISIRTLCERNSARLCIPEDPNFGSLGTHVFF